MDGAKKILIVDDDSMVREMMGMILEEEGYEMTGADDGVEALETYRADGSFDIIITDLNMPRMDGLELINEIRGITKSIPIIVLTGGDAVSDHPDLSNDKHILFLAKDENIEDTIVETVKKL